MGTVSGDRSNRRDRRCPPCRGKGGQQHRQNAHNNTAADPDGADPKERNLHELCAGAKAKEGTKKPSDQNTQNDPDGNRCFTPKECFQPDNVHDLRLACADTAEHSKKLSSLCSAAVQTACNHKDSRSQNQHEQDRGYQIEPHHIRIAAESGQPQKGGILGQIFCRKSIGLLQFCDDLAGIGIFGKAYKTDRDRFIPSALARS